MKPPRPLFVFFLALFFKTISHAENPPEKKSAPEKPNILFLIADQWRAQAFGCAGDPNARTPHLDALAAQSANFIHAVSTVPVCSPTRASLLTGQHALTHGVFLNDTPLAENAVTIAKVLRTAGYDTGAIGKWHVDGHGDRQGFIPRERRQGFDYWKVLECSHDYNHSAYFGDEPEKKFWEGYDAIAQTRDARNFICVHANTSRPFLLWLAWGPPHDPYQTAPEKYRAMFSPEKIVLRENVPAEMAQQARQMLAGYYAHCAALDDCLGELLNTLRETGTDKNTIVVFTSDHGDLLGSHGGRNKQQPFDESIRVPFLLCWPEKIAAKKLDAPIQSEDVMPTLLGLCGVAIPKTVEGLDYSDYLRGGKNPGDNAALIACPAPFGQWSRHRGGREYRGVRTTRYTFVRDLSGPWLLFDNDADPFQMKNLAGDAAHAALQNELDALLTKKLQEAHDEFLPAEKYIAKWGWKVDATGTVPYKP